MHPKHFFFKRKQHFFTFLSHFTSRECRIFFTIPAASAAGISAYRDIIINIIQKKTAPGAEKNFLYATL